MITHKRLLLGLGVLLNFILPWAVYRLCEPHLGETHALMFSAAAPMAWSLAELARSRKVDAISAIVLIGIGLALIAIALGGSPKLLLFRESLITGFIGLVLIGSAMIKRPLFYVLAVPMARAFLSPQSTMATALPSSVAARALAQWESFSGRPWFRRVMTAMTVFVGLIGVTETAIRGALIFSLPTERVLIIAPIVQYGAAGLLLLWTFFYFIPAIRRGELED